MLWVGLALLAVAGGADVISAVFRQTVQQRAVPDHLQGRLSGTFFAVVAGGPAPRATPRPVWPPPSEAPSSPCGRAVWPAWSAWPSSCGGVPSCGGTAAAGRCIRARDQGIAEVTTELGEGEPL